MLGKKKFLKQEREGKKKEREKRILVNGLV